MTKGKSQNPADAHRKAMRKKELKKNKAERTKTREFALVKKDTYDMEDQIEKLEKATDLSAADKSRLAELKAELARIMAKKEEYVKDHPEHRKLVFRQRRDKDSDQPPVPPGEQKRNLFDKRGLPRHPERSIYYDPVMNPYGVPPPCTSSGSLCRIVALREDEVASDDDGADDDIVMPAGPPPRVNVGSSDDESDDDIPMPEGPPPSVLQNQNSTLSCPLPPPPSFVPSLPPPPPPPFTSPLPAGFLPPPPPPSGFTGYSHPPCLAGTRGIFPPPPGLILAPPPEFFQRHSATIQDSFPPTSHRPDQVQHANGPLTGHSSLPPKPSTAPISPSLTVHAASSSATISAGPELRDLKKEATAFVPSSLKRKKASGLSAAAPKVNAAPGHHQQPRPDLVSTLRDQLGAAPPSVREVPCGGAAPKTKNDYQKFLEEMSDILGKPE
ncbi:WW domain binding protein 11-domain-containing protein [Pisolithus marmoratus]|nr:WW domain binding protein 11-domain-containing protein [Pisolithus marmoratus]